MQSKLSSMIYPKFRLKLAYDKTFDLLFQLEIQRDQSSCLKKVFHRSSPLNQAKLGMV